MPSWLTHAALFIAGLAIGRHVGLLEAPQSQTPQAPIDGVRVPAPVPVPVPVPVAPPLPPPMSTGPVAKPKPPLPILSLSPAPPMKIGGRWWQS